MSRTSPAKRPRQAIPAAVFFAAGFVVFGCAAAPKSGDSDSPAQGSEETSVPFVTAPGGGEGGDAALLDGKLQIVDGCVAVFRELPDGAELVVPVFLETMTPRWDRATETLTVGEREYADGDAVSFGGGEASRSAESTLLTIPEPCRGREPYFIVHSLE